MSTRDQELNLQLDALNAAGCQVIHDEKANRNTEERPELAQCLKILREGDALAVWRLDS